MKYHRTEYLEQIYDKRLLELREICGDNIRDEIHMLEEKYPDDIANIICFMRFLGEMILSGCENVDIPEMYESYSKTLSCAVDAFNLMSTNLFKSASITSLNFKRAFEDYSKMLLKSKRKDESKMKISEFLKSVIYETELLIICGNIKIECSVEDVYRKAICKPLEELEIDDVTVQDNRIVINAGFAKEANE